MVYYPQQLNEGSRLGRRFPTPGASAFFYYPQDYQLVPRLSVPLSDQQHKAVKAKALSLGIPQAEIARRLLLLWLVDDLELPQGAEYQAVTDAAVAYYSERQT